MRTIEYDVYRDKVLGCWMGKFIGGTIGAPVEAHKLLMDFSADNCWPDEIAPNDDLDIQMIFLEVLQDHGPFFTQRDLVEGWQDRCWYNFAEYGFFLYNIQRGLGPPQSGEFNNSFFRESMGCPIRAEIWGAVAPGNPLLAAEYGRMDGELDHVRNSIYAEQFLAACVAEAFVSDDLDEIIRVGASQIPGESAMFGLLQLVPELCSKYDDWRDVRRELIRRYGHRDATHVLINQAFIQMALRMGGGCFTKTLLIAMNSGWDTDCTCASAGALLGTLLGASGLPAFFRSKVGERLACDVDARHRSSALSAVVDDTCRVGLEVTEARSPDVRILSGPTVTARGPREPLIELSASYPNGPVMLSRGTTPVLVEIVNRTDGVLVGELHASPPDGVAIRQSGMRLHIPGGCRDRVVLHVNRDIKSAVLWDRNPFTGRFVSQDGRLLGDVDLGLVGARQWRIYGPYFDVYDTALYDECPYHNDRVLRNPHLVPGCGLAGSHNFVRLDREYLDEAALVAGRLDDEAAALVQRGEDHLDADDLGGFTGEACYYLVRKISARQACDVGLALGATGPLAVWVNGVEMLRHDDVQPWMPLRFWIPALLNEGINRIVIKAVRKTDDYRVSMCFIKPDIPGDKKRGVSFIMDQFGEQVREDGEQ